MTNISIIDGNYRDGTKAQQRGNDNIQLLARSNVQKEDGRRIYTPVVALDPESLGLLEENNLLLRIMIKHLSVLTELHYSEDEVGDD